MKVLRDIKCIECEYEDTDYYDYNEYGQCPECGSDMVQAYYNMNYDSHFSGSHNEEYSVYGNKKISPAMKANQKNTYKRRRNIDIDKKRYK